VSKYLTSAAMLALRAGPPQTVTFCAAHKKRQFAPAHAAGVEAVEKPLFLTNI